MNSNLHRSNDLDSDLKWHWRNVLESNVNQVDSIMWIAEFCETAFIRWTPATKVFCVCTSTFFLFLERIEDSTEPESIFQFSFFGEISSGALTHCTQYTLLKCTYVKTEYTIRLEPEFHLPSHSQWKMFSATNWTRRPCDQSIRRKKREENTEQKKRAKQNSK